MIMSCEVRIYGVMDSHFIDVVGSNALVRVSTKSMCYNRYPNHKSNIF